MALSNDDRLVRRNANLLLIAQSLSGASPSIIIALGGLVGQALAPSQALITVPVSLFSLGLAAGTLPAAHIMRRYGRRFGYVLGALIGIAAGLIATQGIVFGSFWLFCLATFMAGFNGSYVQSYRFAATDGASPAQRPALIAKILLGGLIAAILGPQLVLWTKDSLPYPLAGAFLSLSALALLTLPALLLLKPPPIPSEAHRQGRPFRIIFKDPRFLLAVFAGIVSYGLMTFLMTAAPIAMVGCGFTAGEAVLGIQWHTLGMFAPSLITGRLIARFGKERITAIGLVLIALSGVVALFGLELIHFWGSLFLLGVGWNFGFIGATAMITDCHTEKERSKVQGANDFLIFGATALASFSAGGLLTASSWHILNLVIFPLVVLVLPPLLWRFRL